MYEVHGGANGTTKAPADKPRNPGRKAWVPTRARRALLSDDRLAKAAAAGDISAFEAIFNRYQDDLYRFCVGILREPQDAQDAVQNTMVKAMRALPGERREMQLKPWLYRIAHNEAVELRRRERPVAELPVTVDDRGAGTEERAEANGRLRTLLADIADLPERQRASLVMREVNGLGFGEIGAVLGTSPGAVRQALYEARRGLAEMDHGRGMNCNVATRIVSDTDGRPRDRGVRAHVRECSTCRRFQGEIRERSRTLAGISPLPVLAAAGALKSALGGSSAAGVGAAAGGSGAGAGAAGVGVTAGSVGASALLKPAVGLLTVLAIGTAGVDHGAIFNAGRHEPATADRGKSAPALADTGDGARPTAGRVTSRAAGGSVGALSRAPSGSRTKRAGDEHPAAGTAARRRRHEDLQTTGAGLAGLPQGEVLQGPGGPLADVANDAGHRSGATEVAPPAAERSDYGHGEGNGKAAKPEKSESSAPAGSKGRSADPEKGSTVPPGQTKKESVPAGEAKKKAVPPGQAKKESAERTEPTPSESSGPAAAPVEAPTHVPPGQAKKESEVAAEAVPSESSTAAAPTTEPSKVPPGQAKKDEAEAE
jgi:RNA polymerase sigma factor (sigma-70 family)